MMTRIEAWNGTSPAESARKNNAAP